MATEESIDKQLQDLKKRFGVEEPKSIDEQIQDIRKQIEEDEKEEERKKSNETFIKQEKRLLSKIESKNSVIQFLTNALETAEKELKDLEEQLEVIRDCENIYK